MTTKRKSSMPVKADPVKRQELSWNMNDLFCVSNDMFIVDDEPASPSMTSDRKDDDDRSETTTQDSLNEGDVDETLNRLIADCDFYVSITGKPKTNHKKELQWSGLLGKFELKLHDVPSTVAGFVSCLLENSDEFWLYVNLTNGEHLVYILLSNADQLNGPSDEGLKKIRCKSKNVKNGNNDSRVMYFPVSSDLPMECFDGLRSKKEFSLCFASFNSETAALLVDICVLEPSLLVPSFSSDAVNPRRCHVTLRHLVKFFYGIYEPALSCPMSKKKHNIEELYAEVKNCHLQVENTLAKLQVNVQHSCLRPILRGYQKQAVRWMLTKEKYGCEDANVTDDIHPLYEELKLQDGQLLYFNRHCGFLVKRKPLAVRSATGGILADEMGLGKTVEVLACVLIHRRTNLPPIDPLPVLEKPTPKRSRSHAKLSLVKRSSVNSLTVLKSFDGLSSSCNSSASLSRLDSLSSNSERTDFKTDIHADACQTFVDDHSYCVKETETTPDRTVEQVEHCSVNDDMISGHDNSKNRQQKWIVTPDDASNSSYTSNSDIGKKSSVSMENAFIEEIGQCSVRANQKSCRSSKNFKQKWIVTSTDTSNTGDTPKSDIVNKSSMNVENTVVEETVIETEHYSMDDILQSCQGNEYYEQKWINSVNDSSTDTEGYEEFESTNECDQPVTGADDWSKDGGITCVDQDQVTLECQCGGQYLESRSIVKCERCGSYQHADCVNYDVSDPYRGRYLCPHCHIVELPVPSGATLIVAPKSITHQWVDETLRHLAVDALKIMVYTGVHELGYIQPQTLASQDIVITSYETLRKEIHYVDLPHTKAEINGVGKFRNPKRFMALSSPLPAVEWWRICLDEAQMVESTTAKTAEMALRLSSVNRWCVTGTPIQKGVNDLYGLLLFLGVDPYWVKVWWNKLLFEPFSCGLQQPMYSAISDVLWRTAKEDVLDQICLPPQTIEIHWLTFSPVEEHFYRKHYQECAQEAMQKLRAWTDSQIKLDTLDKYTLHQLLTPLVKLRQACCHPQAVRGHYLPLQKNAMTMEELLTHLINKTRLECEEAHRRMVFASTGLAGLHILIQQYVEAVDEYRTMLRSIEEHQGEVRTDLLQILHIVHNLHDVLSLKPEGVGHTLMDSELEDREKEIQQKYLTKSAAFVSSAREAWIEQRKVVLDLLAELGDNVDWWADLLQWVMYSHLDDRLVVMVKDSLVDNVSPDVPNMANRFQSVRGLQYLLADQLEQLEMSRTGVVEHLERLTATDPQHLVDAVVECCLRPPVERQTPDSQLCEFCLADKKLQKYEGKLFFCVKKGICETASPDESDSFHVNTKQQVTWADSDTEKTFKALISFARNFFANKHEVELGCLNLKLFDALKKEFRCLRPVWMSIRERVCAIDEMRMAVSRMRLCEPDEPLTDPPQPNVIELVELESRRLKFVSDKIIARNELTTKKGQLHYLKSLVKPHSDLESGENPEPCPVCHQKLGAKWSVLQCGHCYCLSCIHVLISNYSCPSPAKRQRSLTCAICRQRTLHSDISYVNLRHTGAGNDDDIKVKGDHATKIEGVVRCLLRIHLDDKDAKSLVFSTWPEVLEILAGALQDNEISFRLLQTSRKFEESLQSFKQQHDVNVLLLPIHSGSNGLNLIEATHVLLVEPVLNTAQELQAIGRVHRIGQTRPTVVHRFLVQGTIEVRMHDLLQAVNAPLECHNTEQTTLTIGDLSKLFERPEELAEDSLPGETTSSGVAV